MLRDGKYLGTFETDKISKGEVVSLIAGQAARERARSSLTPGGSREGASRARGEKPQPGSFLHDINLALYEKEILGIYGLQGAGRTELLETLFGMCTARRRGDIRVRQASAYRKPKDGHTERNRPYLGGQAQGRAVRQLLREGKHRRFGPATAEPAGFHRPQGINELSGRYRASRSESR